MQCLGRAVAHEGIVAAVDGCGHALFRTAAQAQHVKAVCKEGGSYVILPAFFIVLEPLLKTLQILSHDAAIALQNPRCIQLDAGISHIGGRTAHKGLKAVENTFSPEFRNRLDAIVSFASLDENIIQQVVDKFLLQLEQQLLAKQVEIEFTDGLKAYLAEKGFDPLMGARPMSRLIQTTIRKALADELLFGKLAEGGRVTVDWDNKLGDVQLIFPTAKSDRELAQACE